MTVAKESEGESPLRTPFADQRSPWSRAYPAIAFVVLLAACCAWILSLPLFPSQDGPVHVYYAQVALDLLRGGSTYAAGFRVAHVLPPYSLHSYLLMPLLRVVPPAKAEELVVCIAILATGLGLLLFCRRLGPSGTVFAVVGVPFLLHRYLFLGFYAYALGLGPMLAGMAVWCSEKRRRPTNRLLFLLFALLAMFSHPVPYLLLLAFCASEAAAGWWMRRKGIPGIAAPTRGDMVALLAAAALVLYVAGYAQRGILWLPYSLSERLMRVLLYFDLVRGVLIAPVLTLPWQLFTGVALLAVTLAATAMTYRSIAARRFPHALLAFVWGLAFLLMFPVIPWEMNGSIFFGERTVVIMAMLLLGAASVVPLSPRAANALTTAGVLATLLLLASADAHVRPLAKRLAVLPVESRTPVHLEVGNAALHGTDVTFDPFYWAGVRVVSAKHAILENSPWMDLSLMMLEKVPRAKPWPQLGKVVTDCSASTTPPDVYPRDAAWIYSRYPCFKVAEPSMAQSAGTSSTPSKR